ncbi:hypothetical protein CDL15_Pgr003960 [Punica granatum]|uniref:Uncharacterized protein n=1 Tax=Punica granatum TaxID=22663 RepID=A0A218WNM4_PUNGR|nr:hypothetical protein CDL15_Pgr003960 [Punica granatum]
MDTGWAAHDRPDRQRRRLGRNGGLTRDSWTLRPGLRTTGTSEGSSSSEDLLRLWLVRAGELGEDHRQWLLGATATAPCQKKMKIKGSKRPRLLKEVQDGGATATMARD